MKKAIRLSLALAFLLALTPTAQGQSILNKLGKKLEKKVNEKVEQKVDDKVDEQLDESLDELFEGDSAANRGESSESREQERLSKIMKGIGMTGEPVPIENSYKFKSKFQMHFESYDAAGKKESEGEFISWANPAGKNFAYEFISGDVGNEGNGLIIMDVKNKAMIILANQEKEKTGIVYGFDPNTFAEMNDSVFVEDYDDPESIYLNAYLKKTGKSKSILGYNCDEYHYDNPEEDTKANFWISKDVDISTKDMMSSIFKSASYSNGMPAGFIMESESWDTKTKERNLMKVTDIDNDANRNFELSAYQLTNLGTMKIPTGDTE
ncbi:DUF4412 domain-containing protein [Mangrovibacterium sp.]|uniref:DUF4412 domain-containing protein n=1 Tax=Mangrovibacterium sp. TaxID=1961364 RepID=UPI0035627774